MKTFTFSAGPKSLNIDKAVLGPIPKHLLLTMIKIPNLSVRWTPHGTDFNIMIIETFALYERKQFHNEGLYQGMDHENTSSLATGSFSKRPVYITLTRDFK